jgi:hypothetical protein
VPPEEREEVEEAENTALNLLTEYRVQMTPNSPNKEHSKSLNVKNKSNTLSFIPLQE